MNEDIMRQAGLGKEGDMVEKKICPFCKKKVDMEDFKDDLSKKEFKISGICQKCQDEFFG